VANTPQANKGYDADQGVIDPLNPEGKSAVISPDHHRKTLRTYYTKLYKARHLIEKFFAKRLLDRAIASPYDPRAVNFPACDSSRCCGHLVELMTRPKLT
jgi:hypothetical protein